MAVSIIGILLLVAGYFWFGRETEIAPAKSPAIEVSGESLALALAEEPDSLDLEQLAAEQLASVERAEAARYESAWIEPLRNWEVLARGMRSGLMGGTAEWCAPYQTVMASAGDWDEAALLQGIEEERAVSEAERSMRLEAAYGSWNDWLIRLAEAELNDAEQKSVESFQTAFGEATDEFEELLSETVSDWQRANDRKLAVPSSRVRWPAVVAQGLASSSIDTARVCAGGLELTPAERQRLLTQVKQWEALRIEALRQNERFLSQMAETKRLAETGLKAEVRAVQQKLGQAIAELRSELTDTGS